VGYKYFMKIEILFENSNLVTVELFDNPGIRKWFEFSKTLDYKFKKSFLRRSGLIGNNKNPAEWENVLQAFENLKAIEYKIPFEISPNFNYDQKVLNQIHRFFTYNCMWWEFRNHQPNPFDPNFHPPPFIKKFKDWLALIDPINDAVHKLENVVHPNKNKFLFDILPLEFLDFETDASSLNFLEFTKEEQQQNFNFMQTEGPVAILNQSILGKSFLQSFFDNDYPRELDCTGRLGSFGGFCIDVNENRKKIYQHPEFIKWLKTYNIDPQTVPYEFAIGQVEFSGPVLNNRFVAIKFVE
jgi:hypothetical protein